MAKVPPKPSGKGAPPEPIHMVGNLDKPEAEGTATLNFKVSEAFKKEFKTYAARRGKPMSWILQQAFEVYRVANPTFE